MADRSKAKKTVLARARAWAQKRKLFGPQAFLRFVMLSFVENINQVTSDFVFKGGNLLWIYIGTPRSTIDLDLATQTTNTHAQVRKLLKKSCAVDPEIRYSIISFEEVARDGKIGASIKIGYATTDGAKNTFDLDIVYAPDNDIQEIRSPIHEELKIQTSTMESIISDKIAASYRFGSGNTRMKDFDDLWRLSRSDQPVNARKLKILLQRKKVFLHLDEAWLNPLLDAQWANHRSTYLDLPENLKPLFQEVNRWLAGLTDLQ